MFPHPLRLRRGRVSVAAGLLALLGAIAVGVFPFALLARDPVEGSLVKMGTHREGLTLTIEADLDLRPRVRMAYQGLEGQLTVADHKVSYEVRGITKGDPLTPGEPHRVTVAAKLDAAALASTAIQMLGSGKLTVHFDGKAEVSVLGLPMSRDLVFDGDVAL